MRLYHCATTRRAALQPGSKYPTLVVLFLLLVFSAACAAAPETTLAPIQVTLLVENQQQQVTLPPGSSVQRLLDTAQVSLGELDRVDPPVYTVLQDGEQVRVIRVSETFEIEQQVIPFERQVLRNESLAKDVQVLLQAGQNGLQEITYRRTFEDGVEITAEPVAIKITQVKDPIPEILMIGIQAPLSPVAIPGKLYYVRDGNVWLMETSTNDRRAVLATGDLDGRVFALSSNSEWLLFTRKASEEGKINSLWVAHLSADPVQLINLKVENVIHFADFVPRTSDKIIFSTVEPRPAAPGWQANNDLHVLTYSTSGWTTKWNTILEANSGGVYGWWGMNFAWSPERDRLAFTRPDSIGVIDYASGVLTTTLNIIPLQTRGDWAWVPGLSWGPDGKTLYLVDHIATEGAASPEESQLFGLTALPLESNQPLRLVSQTGMFAYPIVSPLQEEAGGGTAFQVAYLQAAFPEQSETSRYRLAVMDRDGSDRRVIFPESEVSGIQPQLFWGAWSPGPLPESQHPAIVVIFDGNLWIVDTVNGQSQQITSDGLTTRVIWR